MTTAKTQKIDKYSALINQGFLENKIKMIPTSIKETYSDLVSKKPVLLTRELIADGKVVLGVEYNTDGETVNAYTTDKQGHHVTITHVEDLENDNLSVRDMVAQHLAKMSIINENKKTQKAEETKTNIPQTPAKKRVIKPHPSIQKQHTY